MNFFILFLIVLSLVRDNGRELTVLGSLFDVGFKSFLLIGGIFFFLVLLIFSICIDINVCSENGNSLFAARHDKQICHEDGNKCIDQNERYLDELVVCEHFERYLERECKDYRVKECQEQEEPVDRLLLYDVVEEEHQGACKRNNKRSACYGHEIRTP